MFTRNWRTTLIGIVGAVMQYAMTAGPAFNFKMLLAALPTLLMGAFAKDGNVTGA